MQLFEIAKMYFEFGQWNCRQHAQCFLLLVFQGYKKINRFMVINLKLSTPVQRGDSIQIMKSMNIRGRSCRPVLCLRSITRHSAGSAFLYFILLGLYIWKSVFDPIWAQTAIRMQSNWIPVTIWKLCHAYYAPFSIEQNFFCIHARKVEMQN